MNADIRGRVFTGKAFQKARLQNSSSGQHENGKRRSLLSQPFGIVKISYILIGTGKYEGGTDNPTPGINHAISSESCAFTEYQQL